ncbi:DUF374 domain-containing protein [candidate division KSB1 bacterium]|jgi:hypothetical protein|nr:DUF374 domain-containing protein [candidate division KSB1 bacterium]
MNRYLSKEIRARVLFILAEKLTWLIILLFGKTGRIQIKNRKVWNELVARPHGFIIVAWHGKMLLPIYIHRNLGIVAMVSEHRDGEMIARTIKRLGYETVRGSSTRGGTKAFRQMLKELKKGKICTILPDGPRGPRHHFKLGAIVIAQRSGVPILPMTFAAKKSIRLKSWDRFMLWLPLSKVHFIYGCPITIPRDCSVEELEQYRVKVEQTMIELEQRAEKIF